MNKNILIIVAVVIVGILGVGYFISQKGTKEELAGAKLPSNTPQETYVVSALYQGKSFESVIAGFEEGINEYVVQGSNLKVSIIKHDVVSDSQAGADEAVKKLIETDKPNMILAVGPQMMEAAKVATTEIPIVFGFGGNPNDGKFVASSQSSGNNMTGVTWRAYELTGKRIEILKRIDPTINSVLVYSKKGSAALKSSTDYVNQSASAAGVKIVIREVDTSEEFAADLAKFDTKQFDGVSYLNDPFFVKNNAVFQKTLLEKKIPSVFHEALFAHSGALASYGAEYFPSGKQISRLAKKIIVDKELPTNIPSESATQLNLVLNLNTAKKFGLTFPEEVLSIANQIIPVDEATPPAQ